MTDSSRSSGEAFAHSTTTSKYPAPVKNSGVDQLELALRGRARSVLANQPLIRKGCVRVFVEHPHVGVARDAVEKVVELLDVLAVIALAIGQAEQPLP